MIIGERVGMTHHWVLFEESSGQLVHVLETGLNGLCFAEMKESTGIVAGALAKEDEECA